LLSPQNSDLKNSDLKNSDLKNQASIAAIILAAGASTRMGRPKQLLLCEGQSLLQRITETAIAAGCHPVIVVVGYEGDRIRDDVRHLPVQIVENIDWQTGMGSSICCGIQVLRQTAIDAVMLLLCDQPFVSVETLHQLITHYWQTGETDWQTGKSDWQTSKTRPPIVASSYQGIVGVPALFDQTLFAELATLTGAEGARKIIQHHIQSVITIDFPEGAIDLDTPIEYQRYCQYCRSTKDCNA
jgi:molybdenum cofactor cytidylyltransferase